MDTRTRSTKPPGEASSAALTTGNGLLPALLLHQARRDAAVGLPGPGAKTMSLLEYRRQKEREATASLAGAAFLKAVVDNCRDEVKKMIAGADTPEKRREILPQVEWLNALAERAAAELEKMTYGE